MSLGEFMNEWIQWFMIIALFVGVMLGWNKTK